MVGLLLNDLKYKSNKRGQRKRLRVRDKGQLGLGPETTKDKLELIASNATVDLSAFAASVEYALYIPLVEKDDFVHLALPDSKLATVTNMGPSIMDPDITQYNVLFDGVECHGDMSML